VPTLQLFQLVLQVLNVFLLAFAKGALRGSVLCSAALGGGLSARGFGRRPDLTGGREGGTHGAHVRDAFFVL